MKKRNPIFVAGFPSAAIFIGYIGFFVAGFKSEDTGAEMDDATAVLFLVSAAVILVGLIYTLYWYVSTARALRRTTGLKIPNSFLLLVPFANYWWMWKYGQAAEKFVKNKVQAVLIFILIALLGAIGNAIVQDYFNKQSSTPQK